jgi:hypothetical protein
VTLFYFLSLKNDVNVYVPSKSNKQKNLNQGCGSGLVPDSIGSVDPDPRAKMTHKSRKKI